MVTQVSEKDVVQGAVETQTVAQEKVVLPKAVQVKQTKQTGAKPVERKTVDKDTAKVYVRVRGVKEAASSMPISIVSSALILHDGTFERNDVLTLGRTVRSLEKIEIFTIGENGKENVLATGTCTPKEWSFSYRDGRAEKIETFERSNAHKGKKGVKIELARDQGTDTHDATKHMLSLIGLITKKTRVHDGARTRQTTAAKQQTIDQLVAELLALGVDPARIATITKA